MMSPVKNLVSTIKYIRAMEKILAQSIKSEVECRYAFAALQIENEKLKAKIIELTVPQPGDN